ncbi:MAG: Ig-like domain-containing protein [Dysgonamonadaceae bacterium]|nr:Ig-like domain-containing protein [Dysgonamonadaceae bacterium]
MKHKILLLFIATLLLAISSGTAFAQTVTTINDSGPGSLRQAIANAEAGDEITFSCSLDNATITLASAIVLNKSVTIIGGGQKLVPTSSGYPCFSVEGKPSGEITIERLHIDGFVNSQGWGGGFSAKTQGAMKYTFKSCIFTDNSAGGGGGGAICNVWGPGNSDVYAYGCTFTGNKQGENHGTAIFNHNGKVYAVGNFFFGNTGNTFEINENFGDINNNVYNNTNLIKNGGQNATNIKITANPLDEDFVTTDQTIAILPNPLPAGYPEEDFYGNAIAGGGYAGAAQAGYTDDGSCENVAVTGVTLDQETASIKRELTTVQLTAIVAPVDASNQTVEWSSSDDAIATVNGRGVVTGVSAGEATITATTVDGSFTASATITVIEPAPCELRYNRAAWTATYGSGAGGAYGRKNTPTIMFDDNYLDEGQGWHNAGGAQAGKVSESVVVDMGSVQSVGKVVLYSTGYIGDIDVYLPSTKVAALHAADNVPETYGGKVASWASPASDALIDAGKATYGVGANSNNAYRIEIDIPAGQSSQYIAVCLLNSRAGGTVAWGEQYRNIVEFDAYSSCQEEVTSWEIGKDNAADVKATLWNDGTLAIKGTGAMKDFQVLFGNEFIGNSSTAPWFWDITYDSDNAITAATLSQYATQITGIVIDGGVTTVGSGFFYCEAEEIEENIPTILSGALSLPSTVESVGIYAFAHHEYSSIVLSEGLKTIGDNAFEAAGDGKIEELIIPSTVTSIGETAFRIPSLTKITVKATTPPTIAESTFAEVDKETVTVCIPKGAPVKKAYTDNEYWKEFADIDYCKVDPYEIDIPSCFSYEADITKSDHYTPSWGPMFWGSNAAGLLFVVKPEETMSLMTVYTHGKNGENDPPGLVQFIRDEAGNWLNINDGASSDTITLEKDKKYWFMYTIASAPGFTGGDVCFRIPDPILSLGQDETKSGNFADVSNISLAGTDYDPADDGVVIFELLTNREGALSLTQTGGREIYLFASSQDIENGNILAQGASISGVSVTTGTYYVILDNAAGETAFQITSSLGLGFKPAGKVAVRTVSYNVLGQIVRNDAKGIAVIRHITYDDGTVEVKKEFVLDN